MAPKLFEGLLQWIHKSPTEYFKISRETQQHLLDTVWTTTIRWFGPNYKKKQQNIIYIGLKYQKEMTETLRVPWMKKVQNF